MDHGLAHGSCRSEQMQATDHLGTMGTNPGGILGAAWLLVDPSSPGVVSCQFLCHHHGGDVSVEGHPFNKSSALTGHLCLGGNLQ